MDLLGVSLVSRFQRAFLPLTLLILATALSACQSHSSSSSPALSERPGHPPAGQAGPTAAAQPAAVPMVEGRDPVMEQGARFMTELQEHKRRLEGNPKDKESLLFLGNANMQISRYEQARHYYRRYLELDPNHVGVRTDLATIYYTEKNVEAAVRELKSVLARDPHYPPALFNLGLIHSMDKKDYPEAVATWEALLKENPDHPKAAEVRQRIEEMKKS